MNSSQIFGVIESIAVETSKTGKQRLVADHIGNDSFLRALQYAYDPFKVFGVAEKTLLLVEPGHSGADDFDDSTWRLLDRLASRDLTGGNAFDEITKEMGRLGHASRVLLRRILLKDLRAGFGASTINKAIPGTIPEFPYMRCSLPESSNIDEFDWSAGVVSQEKADAMFLNTNIADDGAVWLTTRQGTPVPEAPSVLVLIEAISDTLNRGTQTHGELLVIDPDGKVLPRELGNGMLNRITKGGGDLDPGHSLRLMVWDQIPLDAVKPKGRHEVPYYMRLAPLIRQMTLAGINAHNVTSIGIIPTRIVRSRAEASAHAAEMMRAGKEGTVVKSRDAIWRDGTSKDQIKFKAEFEVDLKVIGFIPGSGKNAKTFGSILTATSCGMLEVAVSGFSDVERKRISDIRFDLLDGIMTVRANSVMAPNKSKGAEKHSLFLPRFVEFRDDKVVADDLAAVTAQFRAACGLEGVSDSEGGCLD